MARSTAESRAAVLTELFTDLGPAWGRWINACTPATHVSYIRMRLLHSLEVSGDKTMTELANALGVTQRRVTSLVDALHSEGFVERRPHPRDGRSTVVSLTKAGHHQEKIGWDEHQRSISAAFLDLSAEQQSQLIAITPNLTAALRKRTADGSDDI